MQTSMFLSVLPFFMLVGMMVFPPALLPNYKRGGWGKHAK